MLTAHDVADFFLSPVDTEEGEQISNLKLQKLLYYAQGYALAILGRPLFADKIENWQHGPVVCNVYHDYKQHGSGMLPAAHIELDKYQEDELSILNRVRSEQGRYTAWALRDKTHQEAPWVSTRRGEEIGIDILKDYFRQVLRPSGFNFDLDRMKEAVEGEFTHVPNFETEEELLAWLERR
ncbi:putative phage-associated protein [Neisseria sp. HSC-16F19]|nr:type II toxin-antitoxin system antitoxin SocA domain-containing protein [Neisseria sp. HSC-16F19]MCP2041930.1 putative phage-associated protein [Neisseria sp. HSC-16F19]